MGIRDYFSKDINRRIRFMFDLIAPLYGQFHTSLVKEYHKSIEVLNNEINLSDLRVLDVGTGTGAWAAAFSDYGVREVQGIDVSAGMLRQARKRHPDINFSQADIESIPFPERSFDLVTASFVLHGVRQEQRAVILDKMFKISSKYVVLQDFVGRTPYIIRFLEFLERSDYRHFKKNILTELSTYSEDIKVLPLRSGVGLYVVKK